MHTVLTPTMSYTMID
uniref:Uncharacterized protein n=1 Tax=Arundo donax TaxID=35708 RepID=A0A0A9C831_ARUDO